MTTATQDPWLGVPDLARHYSISLSYATKLMKMIPGAYQQRSGRWYVRLSDVPERPPSTRRPGRPAKRVATPLRSACVRCKLDLEHPRVPAGKAGKCGFCIAETRRQT